MEITFEKALRDTMFSSEFSALKFSTSEISAVQVTIKSASGATVFENSYYPDSSDKTIVIYDLDKLFLTNITDICASFVLKIAATEKTINIIKSEIRINDLAENFIANNFLTLVKKKETAPGRRESLTLITSTRCDIVITRKFYKGEAISTSNYSVVLTLLPSSSPQTIDVSPDNYTDTSLGELVEYTVAAGNRVFIFKTTDKTTNPAFIFRNCFGCWETFYFSGLISSEPEFTRSAANINGENKNYKIEVVDKYKAFTGPLHFWAEKLIRDMVRAREIYTLTKAGIKGKAVTITDCDVKYNNDIANLSNFQITYRLSDRISEEFTPETKPDIFDNKFDDKFE